MMAHHLDSGTAICRLCGESTRRLFERTVLRKYVVEYQECDRCKCLQTETPYWLSEAYAKSNLARHDSGAVVRNLDCQAIVYAVARALRLARGASILDFGGGNGLLCRLLRDIGLNAWLYDEYGTNDFAQGFESKVDASHSLVCAFEVVEHLPNPRVTFTELFAGEPVAILVGTQTYARQGAEWWYLDPSAGQHVFFYSECGMALVAERVGYCYLRFGDLHLFTRRPIGSATVVRLRSVLTWRWRRMVLRALLAYRASYRWAEIDARYLEISASESLSPDV